MLIMKKTMNQDTIDNGKVSRGPCVQMDLIDYQSNWYFKCYAVRHIVINCPSKRTLIFHEDLDGWIRKDEEVVKKFKESPLSKLKKKA
ncbi:hypothetical protein M9H77_14225 [Catharanthus roseus]|uniref:Uncharacterized protein n=1 Tax=Catharanthus roseus TaxID=4058 RepID=A0ACC0BMG0_CATRO|nr:hypothetical protein M9H77_14225 [Catharanthus roseus]